MSEDISFTRRPETVFRETNKPINYWINIEHWDDHRGIRLEDPRRELQKKYKEYVQQQLRIY